MKSTDRTPLEVFERLYAKDPDPWNYASSSYERAKYDRTIRALGPRRFERGLEIGCSIGVLTTALADHCESLIAVDPSPTALRRAEERVGHLPGLELRLGAAPEQLPQGPFDLVICSEVLCYLNEPLLLRTLELIEDNLAPGGVMLAVDSRPRKRSKAGAALARMVRGFLGRLQAPLSGDQVHALLRAQTRLALTYAESNSRYRLDRFDSLKSD